MPFTDYDSPSKIFTNSNASVLSNEEIIKRICFLINNLSETNLQMQIDEIRYILPENLLNWLADFLVRRSGSEPNLHSLYSLFIDKLTGVFSHFDETVIELIKFKSDNILRPGKLDDNNTIKTLKNFGSFLGHLTLARDVHVCLDLKTLLRDSYQCDRDSLDYILPFVCHILRGLEFGKVITKYHPWAQELLAIIKELYDLTNKINLQFEIEIFFKSLDISIIEMKSAFYLRLGASNLVQRQIAKSK